MCKCISVNNLEVINNIMLISVHPLDYYIPLVMISSNLLHCLDYCILLVITLSWL